MPLRKLRRGGAAKTVRSQAEPGSERPCCYSREMSSQGSAWHCNVLAALPPLGLAYVHMRLPWGDLPSGDVFPRRAPRYGATGCLISNHRQSRWYEEGPLKGPNDIVTVGVLIDLAFHHLPWRHPRASGGPSTSPKQSPPRPWSPPRKRGSIFSYACSGKQDGFPLARERQNRA